MKALVYGGAFNPPTRAHIDLAEFCMKMTGHDKVIFVPSKMRYIQEDQKKDFAFDDETRLGMLRKAAENRAWMEVSDYELNSVEQPRTYTTLCYLRSLGYTCTLLFGSDKLPELETGWRYVRGIADEFGIVCMERYGEDCAVMIENDPYLSSLKNRITLIQTPEKYHGISSTEVRQRFADLRREYEELCELVPEELDGLREYL
ncbi:MAG: hypothetical protein K6A40_10455 [Solobacterium sp.]|nr:hypothetical protein [Solobacterium sp.]